MPASKQAGVYENLREELAVIAKRKSHNSPPKKKMPPMVGGPTYSKLDFRLVSVKCIEETDEVGSDHILLGGAAIGAFGESHQIGTFTVGKNFDKGETRPYPHFLSGNWDPKDPTKGKVLATFNLKSHASKGYVFPGRGYALSLMMGERDSGGGFNGLVNKVWDKVGNEVTAAIGTQVGEAIGGWLGAVVGAIAGFVVDFLIGAIFNNKDDLVGHATYEMKIMAPWHASFTGAAFKSKQAKSPPGVYAAKPVSLYFKGDGGKYVAKVSWRVRN